jgi:hypothetical protein
MRGDMNDAGAFAVVGAIVGAAALGIIAFVFSAWAALESRQGRGDVSLPGASLQAFRILGLLIPVGAGLGGLAGGIWGFVHNASGTQSGDLIGALNGVLVGGGVLGLVGVLAGTWLGLSYGRDWGRTPTPFAILAFWLLAGLPGCLVGALIGGIWGAVRGG